MLRKYIMYAKQTCTPKLDNSGYDKLAQVYAELRHESSLSQGMPIAVRHLESMIRIAEATALMHLRDTVETHDIDHAIRVMLNSFLSTQKYAVQLQLRRTFRQYLRETGEYKDLLLHLLDNCFNDAQRRTELQGPLEGQRDHEICVLTADFEERARTYHVRDVEDFYASAALRATNYQLDRERGFLVLLLANERGFDDEFDVVVGGARRGMVAVN